MALGVLARRAAHGAVRRRAALPRACVEAPSFASEAHGARDGARTPPSARSGHETPPGGATAAAGASVDAGEVSKFAALAAQWWDADGAFAPLLQMSAARGAFLREACCRHFGARDASAALPLEGLRALDVGCGGGLLAEPLSRLGCTVTAVDAAAEGVGTAAAHAAASADERVRGVEFIASTAEELVAQGRRFDLVCSLEVIEHVADPQEFVRTLTKLVVPGGALALSTINRTPRAYALAIGAAEHALGLVPVGTHEWRKFVSPEELAAMLARAGAEVRELAGMRFDPVLSRWVLSDDTAVNYIALARLSGGLQDAPAR